MPVDISRPAAAQWLRAFGARRGQQQVVSQGVEDLARAVVIVDDAAHIAQPYPVAHGWVEVDLVAGVTASSFAIQAGAGGIAVGEVHVNNNVNIGVLQPGSVGSVHTAPTACDALVCNGPLASRATQSNASTIIGVANTVFFLATDSPFNLDLFLPPGALLYGRTGSPTALQMLLSVREVPIAPPDLG